MKRNYGVRCSEITHLLCSEHMERLNMSISSFMEALCILQCLQCDNKLTSKQLDQLLEECSTSRRSRITNEFRNVHKSLPFAVKKELLRTVCELSMMEEVEIIGSRNANLNLWVNDKSRYLFYYAVGDFRKQPLDEHVNSLDITVETVGKKGKARNEYIYLGRHEQFMKGKRESELFRHLCMYMQIPYCDCIRLHYSELQRLVTALKMLTSSLEGVGGKAESRGCRELIIQACEREMPSGCI